MNKSKFYIMKKSFKAVASSMVIFALILSAASVPATAVAQIGSNLFDFSDQTNFSSDGSFSQTSGSQSQSESSESSSYSETKCEITASQNQVEYGGSVVLSWDTSGFTNLTIDGDSVSGDSGSKTINNLKISTSFKLVATNNSGSSCTQTVFVGCDQPPATEVECTLTPIHQTIAYGDKATLNWTTENANDVHITSVGSVVSDGSIEVGPLYVNTDITLTATNDSDSAKCHVWIKVEQPPVETYCELDVNKTVNKTSAKVRDILTYTITVKNIGTADCTGGVKIVDDIDSNLIYKSHYTSANISDGYNSKPVYDALKNKLRFDGGVFEPGEKGTITWVGEVSDTVACGDFEVLNQAKATAKELNNFDNWSRSQTVKTDIDNDCVIDWFPQPECPYTSHDGIVVEFKAETALFSSVESKSRTTPVSVNIPAGEYSVSLVSWDGHFFREDQIQNNEQYKAVLSNGTSDIASTNPTDDLQDGTATAYFEGEVNSSFVLPTAATKVYALHSSFLDRSSANSLVPICGVFTPKTPNDKYAEVVAQKIVCTDEADLPNYGNGGPDINSNTASTWVNTHSSCSLVPGWDFEWTDIQANDPGDVLVGPAGSPWNKFGSTDANGKTSVTINLDSLSNDRVWFREVLKDGYIPFTHGLNGKTNVDDVTAEFYCHDDVKNYDNYDFVENLQDGNTYHCIAWNSPKKTEVPVPTCDLFTANPGIITVGGSTTLTWETSNSVQTYINGIGLVDPDGSMPVSPLADVTYILTVTGAEDQTVNCEVPVIVSEDPVPVCEFFTATPGSFDYGGGTANLEWKVLNATEVTIDNNVGIVVSVGNRDVIVTESTTFKLTAKDVNGDEVSCIAPVLVGDQDPFTCEGNVSFTASDTSIKSKQNVTLNWSTNDVDSVLITGINLPGLSGSEVVAPTDDITYTLTATQGDRSINCPVSIDVDSGGGGGGGSSSPRCELDISDSKIKRGEEITITWDTRNATEITLLDDNDKVLFTTDDFLSSEKKQYLDGSITIKPTRDTEYTLLAEKGSKDKECSVDVEIDDPIVVLQTRDQQPLVAGISLSQVPYTGFEAGPVMTIMFYMLLVAWALYIAYLVVLRKRGPVDMNNGSFEITETRGAVENMHAMNSAQETRPDLFVESITETAPTVVVPNNLPTGTPVVGYQNFQSDNAEVNPHQVSDEVVTALENRAHEQKSLLSSDAVRHFISTTSGEVERNESLDQVISEAKITYPLEDGWVVINESRMKNLCEACKENAAKTGESAFLPATIPEGTGSLAEAIVTGNIVAAYDMIGSRPMFSLADAASDLDAVYRSRKDSTVQVSNLLTEETKDFSDEKIKDMITALTGALDGTYTDEASAVKMAIMKAVKELG
jgi:uncharacterized repeat protein (TIGR01451 family)